jgi:hypothetical protein
VAFTESKGVTHFKIPNFEHHLVLKSIDGPNVVARAINLNRIENNRLETLYVLLATAGAIDAKVKKWESNLVWCPLESVKY